MDIEIILLKQLAGYLNMPVFLMGADERVVFFNEAAEALLGLRFSEIRELRLDDLPNMFRLGTEDGSLLPLDAFPLAIALRQRRPAHLQVKYRSLDRVWRSAEVTAFPLEGQGRRHLGAMALWWEASAL